MWAMETPKPAEIRCADVEGCARCGGSHPSRTFRVMRNHPRYTHFAICPATGQPILMTAIEDGE